MNLSCVHFLQWALPQIDMEWSGFRKVRNQVCKRIKKRMHELDLPGWNDYRKYLEMHLDEWKILDGFCRITISRFYRDYYLFDYLVDEAFPKIIHAFQDVEQFNCISLGCASGEEPYTLAIAWEEKIRQIFPKKSLQIIGLDVDANVLERAKKGVYSSSSLRELPITFKEKVFTQENEVFNLKEEFKLMVDFVKEDLRSYSFTSPLHLVCCRNLVATYFSEKLQVEIFTKIRDAMPTGAVLMLGTHEKLPIEVEGFQKDNVIRQIYWRV